MSGHRGCKRPDMIVRNKQNAKHRMSDSPEFMTFCNAKYRCNNPHAPNYPHYGGRGIEFRFQNFKEFYTHVGPRPFGMSLDRIDVNGHYELGNVRWATVSEQIANPRNYSTIDQFTDEELRNEMARRGLL